MAIIDSDGLFKGERLSSCSDIARLYWPYLYLGSNGYARLELSYISISSEIFVGFKNPPSEDELWSIIEEYANNFLVILYQSDSIWWAQFDTSEKYLNKYKTVRDERSPAAPEHLMEKHKLGYAEWKKTKSIKNQRFQKFFQESENFPKERSGIGVGIGEDLFLVPPVESHAKSEEVQGIIEIPCIKDEIYRVRQSEIDKFSIVYPAIDVKAEILRAAMWCETNKPNRKTLKGTPSFLNRWLGKAQNSAPRKEVKSPEPPKKERTYNMDGKVLTLSQMRELGYELIEG